MRQHIYQVQKWDTIQENERQDYLSKCKANNVPPQSTEMQSAMFPKFGLKQGFVFGGTYPIYKKRKKDFNYLLQN